MFFSVRRSAPRPGGLARAADTPMGSAKALPPQTVSRERYDSQSGRTRRDPGSDPGVPPGVAPKAPAFSAYGQVSQKRAKFTTTSPDGNDVVTWKT